MSAAEYWLDKIGQAPVFFGPETAELVLAGHPQADGYMETINWFKAADRITDALC